MAFDQSRSDMLVKLVIDRYDVITIKSNDKVYRAMRNKAWQEVVDALNAEVDDPRYYINAYQAKKRWYNVRGSVMVAMRHQNKTRRIAKPVIPTSTSTVATLPVDTKQDSAPAIEYHDEEQNEPGVGEHNSILAAVKEEPQQEQGDAVDDYAMDIDKDMAANDCLQKTPQPEPGPSKTLVNKHRRTYTSTKRPRSVPSMKGSYTRLKYKLLKLRYDNEVLEKHNKITHQRLLEKVDVFMDKFIEKLNATSE